jgi:aspartate-semialdehyde dehydrogenase
MCASVKPTFSTASVWRYEKDSTILIPEVNYQQAERLLEQARARGWKGFIAPGPNCTSVGPVIALTAMGILGVTTKIYFDSKQAVSGAGAKELARLREQREDFIRLTREEYLKKWGDQKLYEANVRCKIPKEVDKVCKEIRLITGHDRFKINGLCHRVPTEFGHVVSIYAETSQQLYLSTPTLQQRIERFNRKCVEDFGMLYSSPQCFVRVTENEFGPEPLKEAEEDGGMCTTIGQLENLDGISGFKFDVLSHNLKKGAGKGGIQTAEYLHSAGYF